MKFRFTKVATAASDDRLNPPRRVNFQTQWMPPRDYCYYYLLYINNINLYFRNTNRLGRCSVRHESFLLEFRYTYFNKRYFFFIILILFFMFIMSRTQMWKYFDKYSRVIFHGDWPAVEPVSWPCDANEFVKTGLLYNIYTLVHSHTHTSCEDCVQPLPITSYVRAH